MVACADDLAKDHSAAVHAMFVFSDGDDNFSHIGRDEVLRTLIRTRIRVYAIGKKNESDPWQNTAAKGVKTLKQFAETTGGKAFVVKSERDSHAAVSEIASDLSSLCVVSAKIRSLSGDIYYKLEVKSKAGVTIHAPQLVFAPLN